MKPKIGNLTLGLFLDVFNRDMADPGQFVDTSLANDGFFLHLLGRKAGCQMKGDALPKPSVAGNSFLFGCGHLSRCAGTCIAGCVA